LAGGIAIMVSEGSGNGRCVAYLRTASAAPPGGRGIGRSGGNGQTGLLDATEFSAAW